MCGYLERMPKNQWVDFLRGVPEENIPVLIGLVCCWCNDPSKPTADDWVDFDEVAGRIRHKRDFEAVRLQAPYEGKTIILPL
jgi:hypothetical protein